VTDGELEKLLAYEWRAQLTAAWLAGFTRRDITATASASCCWPAVCASPARDSASRWPGSAPNRTLNCWSTTSIDTWPANDLFYDQHWAMGALLHLDARLDTHHASQFLADGGAWQRWADAAAPQHADPDSRRGFIDELCSFADDYMRCAGSVRHARNRQHSTE